MSLNGGFGDITEKNVVLGSDTISREHMSAVKHGNGIDWWLVLFSGYEIDGDSIHFIKYLIDSTGISGPYKQPYGDVYHGSDSGVQAIGQMKFSPTGDRMAVCKGQDVDIFDFNRCTGAFSNYLIIDTVFYKATSPTSYGLEFSPDGRLIYVGSAGPKPYLDQFCLSCPTPVAETKTIIYKGNLPSMDIGQLQIAPNNKIYMTLHQDQVRILYYRTIFLSLIIRTPLVYFVIWTH